MLCSSYDRELLSATFTVNGKRLLSACHRESLRLVLKLGVLISQFTVFIESRFSFLNSFFYGKRCIEAYSCTIPSECDS